jgi:hypothetical protein
MSPVISVGPASSRPAWAVAAPGRVQPVAEVAAAHGPLAAAAAVAHAPPVAVVAAERALLAAVAEAALVGRRPAASAPFESVAAGTSSPEPDRSVASSAW